MSNVITENGKSSLRHPAYTSPALLRRAVFPSEGARGPWSAPSPPASTLCPFLVTDFLLGSRGFPSLPAAPEAHLSGRPRSQFPWSPHLCLREALRKPQKAVPAWGRGWGRGGGGGGAFCLVKQEGRRQGTTFERMTQPEDIVN